MGQYWKIINVDKKEYISPFQVGSGLKLWEQLANDGPGRALLILVANMPEPRGGGDFGSGGDGVVGRWAGDRIIMVGDYADDADHPTIKTAKLYEACEEYKEVSHLVRPVLEAELNYTFTPTPYGTFDLTSKGAD